MGDAVMAAAEGTGLTADRAAGQPGRLRHPDDGERLHLLVAAGGPQGAPDRPTTTTPAGRPQVVIGVGASAISSNCPDASCRWVTMQLSGLRPGTAYDVVLHDAHDVVDAPLTKVITTGPDGTYRVDRSFFYGFPGYEVWVTVGSVQSNRLTWPS